MVLQDGNLLLLTSSTSGRNYSRSGRKSLYPDLAVDIKIYIYIKKNIRIYRTLFCN